ncbi:MAG: adenylosuccinate lyase [Aggregatilineales bacterium]
MTENYTHETYLSPFTWRYGSEEMRRIWSDGYKRDLWRRIWVALAEAEQQVGLVTEAQVEDLRLHQHQVDIDRAHEIEAEIHHDLMAEVRTYAEQATIGGGIIHLGATSMDIEDNADALRLRESLDVVIGRLKTVLVTMSELIFSRADQVCMAFTHLQPAEPTTVGYRFAMYAQDFLADWDAILRVRDGIKGKGLKGAVGTSASYTELLHGTGMTPRELETLVMDKINLPAFEIATQTYTRRQDWEVLNVLAGISMTVYKFAFDLRLLQSPPFGEWSEPFGSKQVGSSAMPFKRNPINAENMDSLARYMATLPRVAWDNGAHNLLERTLDDSGNRRVLLPEAFLTMDELLKRLHKVLAGLRIDEAGIARNLSIYGVFAATERVLMEGVRNGGDRQELHEIIREHSLVAWEGLRLGGENPLMENLATDERITTLVEPQRVRELLDASVHIGDAPERARNIAGMVRAALAKGLAYAGT